MTEAAPTTLADLRAEIDRIDSEMHALLMERSSIIETLIAIKKTQVLRLGLPPRPRGRHDEAAGAAP
jgi:chorismate mutase